MGKQRPAPSLPKLRCLDIKVDADDAQAGAVVAGTFRDLVEALDPEHWRNRQARLDEPTTDKPRRRRARRARPAAAVAPDAPVELLVPAEALERPAPAWPREQPVVSPRARSMPPPRRRIPKSAKLVPMTLDDPDYAGAPTQIVAPPPGATLNGHGLSREWQAPAWPQVHVVAVTRGDVLNYMHARRHIDRASYQAGRRYQAIHEAAAPLRMRSVDVGMPPISGIRSAGNYGAADEQSRAAARLDQVHAQLHADIGAMGVRLVTDILALGMTIEACAAARGDGDDKQAVRFWGSLFRRCLRHLAVVLGYSTAIDAPRPPGRAAPGAKEART